MLTNPPGPILHPGSSKTVQLQVNQQPPGRTRQVLIDLTTSAGLWVGPCLYLDEHVTHAPDAALFRHSGGNNYSTMIYERQSSHRVNCAHGLLHLLVGRYEEEKVLVNNAAQKNLTVQEGLTSTAVGRQFFTECNENSQVSARTVRSV